MSGQGLHRILSALATIQRTAATGSLTVPGPQGGTFSFSRGVLAAVFRPAPSSGETAGRSGDTRSTARSMLVASIPQGDKVAFSAARGGGVQPASAVSINAGDLILDLVAAALEPSQARKELQGMTAPLSPNGAPPPVAPKLALSPSAGYLMSRADGTTAFDAILAVSPLDERETILTLYGLVASGLLIAPGVSVSVAPAQQTAQAADPAHAPAERKRVADLDDFLKKTSASGGPASMKAAAPPAPPANASRPATAAPAPPDEERLEVLARISACLGADHWTVLGVPRTADEPAVRRAYYKIAKSFHPDRFRRPAYEDILEQIEQMFATTTEAYNVLTDDKLRADYERQIAEGSGAARGNEMDFVAKARESYLRGRKHLEADELFDAAKLLESACKMDPTKAEYWLYLGHVQTRNPRWRRRAEECFLKAAELNPAGVVAHQQLARLYKAGGLSRKAAEAYEKVLQWEPDNKEALEALGRRQGEPRARTEDTGRMRLKSLFKGGKS